MSLLGRYYSERDLRLINSFNAELLNDIVQTVVVVYKMAASETQLNVYGEASAKTGVQFFPGISITAYIERADFNTEYDNFGPDRNQNLVFKFKELALKEINFYPEVGDLVEFNTRFYECDNVVNNEHLIGGQPSKSFSLIVNTHYTKLSHINLVLKR